MNEAKREPAPKLVFTPEEVAERLKCGRTTVYALLASGKLASVRIGRLRRIPTAALDQYIQRLLEEFAVAEVQT